ncbi:MAG: aminoacylase, partial [Rhizobiaceae bacterium]
MGYDFVIRNGTIIDGMRLPRYRADLGVIAGKIARIGRIPAGAGAQEYDATGLIVAPGFVDLHTHYDAQLHWDPWCTSGSWHGVTTVVMGNCGFGFAPLNPADRERSMLSMTRTEQISLEAMQAGMRIDWTTFPEYLASLRKMPKGVNVATYVPLNPLLVYVKGMEAAKAGSPTTPEQLRRMQELLHEAMEVGAIGFSLQRLGPNSGQADYDGTPMPTDLMSEEDIFALCDVLRERDQGMIQWTHGDRA